MLATPLAVVRRQRLLTSRAHRLRKPHRTTQTSDVLCRRTGPGKERSTLDSTGPDPARAWLRHRGVSTTTNPDPRTPSAGSISDLAIEAGSHALTLTFARARPAPFSPTANRPLSFLEDRRVKLTLAGATSLSTRFALPGRCVYPASATDLQHEHSMDPSVLESPSPSAFAGDDSFHAARPAETLAESMIEWSFA